MRKVTTKLFALYLPQFHQIPENDKFWGKGFTDWVSVKNAKPIFDGHNQPKVPLNENYYDLSNEECVEWQAKLAYDHGIYGFAVYHYWFNNKQNILTRPAEILRDSKIVNVKYFYIWDNNNWKRSWSNVQGNDWAPSAENSNKTGPSILIPYILGEENDWENHYNYLRKHFKSDNYEKNDNKPIFAIISYSNEMYNMCQFWNKLAKKDGFDGLYFIVMRGRSNEKLQWASKYTYQPHYVSFWKKSLLQKAIERIFPFMKKTQSEARFFDYDQVWQSIIKQSEKDKDKTIINCAFVDYDDSPRRGATKSSIFKGATPEKFKKYFKQLLELNEDQGKEYLFITAWNEWGEGAFIEPDEINKMSYLDAIKEVVHEINK